MIEARHHKNTCMYHLIHHEDICMYHHQHNAEDDDQDQLKAHDDDDDHQLRSRFSSETTLLLAPLGALSRRTDRDNRLPSHPSIHPTYSSECSKPFYSDLKQTVTDRHC